MRVFMPTTLREFIDRHERLFVLTGAGCSTGSGIPDYRDADGEWKRAQPVTFQDFLASEHTRKRYWARGLVGWQRLRAAQPNAAHRSLAALEYRGRVEQLVTQNVDGLHQAAGSRNVIDLHGRADVVRCLDCERRSPRAELHAEMFAGTRVSQSSTRSRRRTATRISRASTSRRSTCRRATHAAGSSNPTSCSSARACHANAFNSRSVRSRARTRC